MFLTTKALVLRETKYKESDKLLTVLTEDRGKLTVKARRALQKSCKYASAAQPFAFSEMTLFQNRGRWSLNEAHVTEQFVGLRRDIDILALANYFVELMEEVTEENSPDGEVLRLGLNSLYALSRDLFPPAHIKAVFELRLMCLSGFEPMLWGCSVCEKEAPENLLFSLAGGVSHCASCNPGSFGPSVPLSPEVLEAMRHIAGADPKRIFAFSLDSDGQRRLADLAESYVQAQLDRSSPALGYYKTVRSRPAD